MQDYPPHLFSPCYQKSPDSAGDNIGVSTDVPSIFTHTRAPINPHEWSPSVMPAIENTESSLTTSSGATEIPHYVAHPSIGQTAWYRMPSSPLTNSDPLTDAHLIPWPTTAEAESPHGCAPQTGWARLNVAAIHPYRSQVPSGNVFGRAWSHRGDHRHAVGAPAQPPLLRDTGFLASQVPIWIHSPACSEIGASYRSTSQVCTTGLNHGSPWMAGPVLGQVPSMSHHRRHTRRPYSYPERVICDQCQKSMRRQSLKRHIREVHNRIKRHVKSGFDSGT